MSYVLACSMRDAVGHLAPWWAAVRRWTAQPARIVPGVNDSVDGTVEACLELARRDDRVEVLVFTTGVARMPRVATRARAAYLATCWNRVLHSAVAFDGTGLGDIMVCSVQKYVPATTVASLIEARTRGAVVAPWIVRRGVGFYDTWCFRQLNGARFAHGAPRPQGIVEVGAVGGVYLASRVVHVACRLAATVDADCESVAWSAEARQRGYRLFVNGTAAPAESIWAPAEWDSVSN